jgi:hypothetical protein
MVQWNGLKGNTRKQTNPEGRTTVFIHQLHGEREREECPL